MKSWETPGQCGDSAAFSPLSAGEFYLASQLSADVRMSCQEAQAPRADAFSARSELEVILKAGVL